jgi:hypothetical protein
MPLRETRARRIVHAVLENMDDWMERLREVEAHANPGNKIRSLELLRDMERCRQGLRRLVEPGDG